MELKTAERVIKTSIQTAEIHFIRFLVEIAKSNT
jgi:hypothetical protein